MTSLAQRPDHATTQEVPQLTLWRMITGGQIAQALHAAAQLQIADQLIDGPLNAEELARRCGAHAPTLARLLRALASLGVFSEDEQKRFCLTEAAQFLRSDVPNSLRPLILLCHTPAQWNAWGNFAHSIRTGENAFQNLYHQGYWAYLNEHPEEQRLCYEALSGLSVGEVEAIFDAYDFSPYQLIVDIAGGWGKLLTSILQSHAHARGILFDLPFVAEKAAEQIGASVVGERCQVEGGDMFTSVPAGGDLYILKTVSHDWDDAQVVKLLRNCRAAMKPGARLLIIELVLAPRNVVDVGKFMDMFLLAVIGGQERTAEEFQCLVEEAGLVFGRVIPTRAIVPVQTSIAIIECRKREDDV